MRARLVLSALGAAILLVVTSAPALADDVADGWADVGETGSFIEFGAESGPEWASSGSGESHCTWEAADPNDPPGIPGIFEHGGNQDFDWYVKECIDPRRQLSRELIGVPAEAPPVDPVALRETAVDRLGLPAPSVSLNPPEEPVVHVETWLWIDDELWRTHRESVSAGGVTVSVAATPERVVWDMGNGDTVVCDGPGTPYDPDRPAEEQSTDCSYVYRHSSAGQPGDTYPVTATVQWAASWQVAGAAGGGALPPLSSTTQVEVRVAELQALNE